MRLTLRTLLAHEHGLLNEQQAEVISQKIEQSPFVSQLLRHLKDRAARREVIPLALEARGTASLERVTRYLDHALDAESVVKLENECFASDRLLAEIASCHEILAQWLSTPAPIEVELRQRLYAVMPGPVQSLPEAADELAIDLPALAFQGDPPKQPVAERVATEPKEKLARHPIWSLVRLTALAASVMALVAFAYSNRDAAREMIAQHWKDKSSADVETSPKRPLNEAADAPKTFAATTEPIEPMPEVAMLESEPNLLPEVATTAFHMPVKPEGGLTSISLPGWTVEKQSGSVYYDAQSESWKSLPEGIVRSGRVVVGPHGQCLLNDADIQLEAASGTELIMQEPNRPALRYGKLSIYFDTGSEFALDVSGQKLLVRSMEAMHLELTTSAVTPEGIDFASAKNNQEVQICCKSGLAEIEMSSCRGPFSLGAGQTVIANMNSGVRGGEVDGVVAASASFVPDQALAVAFSHASDPVDLLQKQLSSSDPIEQISAAKLLCQMGRPEALLSIWNQQTIDSRHVSLSDVQSLLAQDAGLAATAQRVWAQTNPEHGRLVYRLVCGFSEDQRNSETETQLKTLLRHPEPSVRLWSEFHLANDDVFTAPVN
ncbi:hypothetical protein ACYFX5_17935 [Bremerella sp. T1]|uniref:hypothetical protein n=1 Tax=Bremerella sp. TYQ1 TaxID=3119568 RepID=UPI001CCE15F8|nr:hypothetical protein [Bremerella volcania]UBM34937.1 hypothetical protein LA756_19890 [Bremerella volcania]